MVKVCGASDLEVNKIGAWDRKGWPPLTQIIRLLDYCCKLCGCLYHCHLVFVYFLVIFVF